MTLVVGHGAAEREAPGGTLSARLDMAHSLLAELASELEPGVLTGPHARLLFEKSVAVTRLADTLKTLLAGRLDEVGFHRQEGFPSAASLLADIEGVGLGAARGTLERAEAASSLPGLDDALRKGELSAAQAAAITDAAQSAPEATDELIDAARREALPTLKEKCRKAKAASASSDPAATARKIHAERNFRHWRDAEGAFCFSGRDLPERGARLVAILEKAARAHFEAARDKGSHEPPAAYLADALFDLVTTEGTSGPPATTLLVRVDLDVVRNRRVGPGQLCEADGVGSLTYEGLASLADDAFVSCVFERCGTIEKVATLGRHIPQALRHALALRDPVCVVPKCTTRAGLEIDHVVPFADGGPTSLDNLARLCHHHHYLKTYEGVTLTPVDTDGAARSWRFEAPVPFGQEPDLGLDRPDSPKMIELSRAARAGPDPPPPPELF